MIGPCCGYLSVRYISLDLLMMSRTPFRVNPHSIVARFSRNSLPEVGAKSELLVTTTGLEPRTTLVHKRTLNAVAKPAKRLSWFVSTYLYGAFD